MTLVDNRQRLEERYIKLLREEVRVRERDEYEDSLYLFLRSAWKYLDSAQWVDGWPIEAIAEHLQAVCDGDIRRLIINIPPRCGKSNICSIAFPAWVWAQSTISATSGPQVSFLHASYGYSLSERDSEQCKHLITTPWYKRYWGDRFSITKATAMRLKNSKNGARLITSIGGRATGEGGDIIVTDDPNAANEVESEATTEATIEWWDGTMSTRLNDMRTGAMVIIQQRLGEDDLTGHVLSKTHGDWQHLCYDENMEILTERGWLPFKELQSGMCVLGVDPTTLEAKWELPTRIVREPYTGDLIHYKSMTADLCVTPDHRMIYGDINDMTGGDTSAWRVRAASDLPAEFYLPQVVKWDGQAGDVVFGERIWEPMAFAEFMGWYLSEGCASAKYRTTRIVQSYVSPDFAEIDRVMEAAPFHVTRGKNSETMHVWSIKDRHLAAELEELGKSTNKRAPGVLKELAPEYLRAFLMAYARGDGHLAVRNNLKITIGTASERMADDLQECAVKAGWASSRSDRTDRSGGSFPGGVKRKPSTIYSLYLRASKIPGRERKMGSRVRANHTTRVPYDGTVYCVSVPSTGVVVRRNGRVSISGNCLPMEYEPERSFSTLIGWKDPRTEPGELLWPERFGPDEVRLLKADMGPFKAAGQLQQRPEPAGGGVIKREWWQPWDEAAFPPMDFILASLDTAYTEKTMNDASALTVWGVFSTDAKAVAARIIDADGRPTYIDRAYDEGAPRVMLMHAWQDRLELHELVERVAKSCRDMKIDKLLIEAKASGISVAQEMRRLYGHEDWAVQLIDPKSLDKLSRLYSVQHLFAEGMIYAPDKAWAEMVITQVGQFPKGRHDDLVDTVSQALRHLRDIGLIVRAPERIADIENMKQYTGRAAEPLYPV